MIKTCERKQGSALKRSLEKKSVKILDFLWMSNAADDDAGWNRDAKVPWLENIGNCENVAEFLCFDKFKCDKVVHHSFSNSYTFFGVVWNIKWCSFKTQCLKIAKLHGV